MKKVYLSFLGLTVLGTGFAQKNYELKDVPAANFASQGVGVKPSSLSAEKAAGVMVWTDGFTDPATWTIDNDGQSSVGFGWDIGATENSWWTSQVINSVTDGNFAELNNGDPQASTQALDVTYTLTTATPVTIPSGQVTLSFLQYGARFNDAQEMYISTDGLAWTLVGDNSDHPVLSQSGGAAYTNPTAKSINLGPFLPALTTSVYIRFQWTTAYPTSASNPNVWITYGWMIDDVTLTTNADDDIAENKVLWGATGTWTTMPYYQIPTSQIAPIDFGGILQNNGINDQNDIIFNADAGAYAGASLASTILSNQSDTIWVENPLTPTSTLGATTVSFSSESGVDDVTTNNGTLTDVTFEVTEFIYARDNDVVDGTQSNGGLAYEVGNVFDIFADQTLYSVDVVLKNTTVVGSLVHAILYGIDLGTGDFTELDRSDDHEVVTADFTGSLTLPLINTTDLAMDTPYLVVVGSDGGTSPDVVVQAGGDSEPQTSFYKDETGTWFYTTNTPMVRMNFKNEIGIKEQSNSFGMFVYPNPTEEQATVAFNMNNESTVTITVSDLSGKTVCTNNLGSMNAGNHKQIINTESFTSGVYYVTISTNDSKVTKKLIKR